MFISKLRKINLLMLLVFSMTVLSSYTYASTDKPSNWAKEDIDSLKTMGLLDQSTFTNYKENISREGFIYIAVTLYETLTGESIIIDEEIEFKDTKNPYALKAATIGLTNGIGKGMFGSDLSITREEMVSFLVRVLKLADVELKEIDDFKFDDEGAFSPWAKENIYICKSNSIVGGVSDKLFSPKGKANKEMALIVAKRILNSNGIDQRKAIESHFLRKNLSMEEILKKYEHSNDVILEANKVSDTYDYDGDGLSDWYEIYRHFTDPNKWDTDGDGLSDGDWQERKEYTYTVEVEARLIKPYDKEVLEDHIHQDIKVIEETDDYLDLILLIYPFDKLNKTIVGNPNWKKDNRAAIGYIEPGVTNDWDEAFKTEIIQILKENNIHPENLTDLELFIRALNLIESKYVSYDKLLEITDNMASQNMIHMVDWYVIYEDGIPVLNKKFLEWDHLKERFANNLRDIKKKLNEKTGQVWTDDDIFATVSSKVMLERGFHGSCSSTAAFYASVCQALGIPAKVMPMQSVLTDTKHEVDNYDGEYKMLKPYTDSVIEGFESDRMRKSWSTLVYEDKLGGSGHVINYVYLGNRWLNVDIAGGFRFNRTPLQGRAENLLAFHKIADYDFADNLKLIAEHSFTADHDFYETVNKSKNFNESPANELPDNYRHFQYKNYSIKDHYGKHISDDNRMYVDSFDNWDYQKDMVRYLKEFE